MEESHETLSLSQIPNSILSWNRTFHPKSKKTTQHEEEKRCGPPPPPHVLTPTPRPQHSPPYSPSSYRRATSPPSSSASWAVCVTQSSLPLTPFPSSSPTTLLYCFACSTVLCSWSLVVEHGAVVHIGECWRRVWEARQARESSQAWNPFFFLFFLVVMFFFCGFSLADSKCYLTCCFL